MDYGEQEKYFAGSRIWGTVYVAALLICAVATLLSWSWTSIPAFFGFLVTVIALATSLYYAPDYLHLTVDPDKRKRWAVRVRWRIAAGILIVTAIFSFHGRDIFAAACTATWIASVTLAAKRLIPGRWVATFFLATDLALTLVLIVLLPMDILLAAVCLAALIQFSVLLGSGSVGWAVLLVLVDISLLGIALVVSVLRWMGARIGESFENVALLGLLLGVLVVSGATQLVRRARKHHDRTVLNALFELADFTGYTRKPIRELWSTSDKQLAENWESSGVANASPDEIAQWYRANSELYMFAISAYNLEYKRMRSNLKMLRFGSGACLDYGAGNGELILELARRGHRAVYYDVDGVSKRFAQHRAALYDLTVDFASAKDDLRRLASPAGFDTIFSFDVLEHIPDLAGELDFLMSLLNPGGLLIFDVPAGATVSHPMHLNHTLDIRAHLTMKGMKEVRLRSWRISKQEKYAFRKLG